MMKNKSITGILFAVFALSAVCAHAAVENRFDIETFECPGTITNHFCNPQFEALNWHATNGHYLVMGSDSHRQQITAQGNALAIYYDVFNQDYEKLTAAEKADAIEKYSQKHFTKTGPRPQWIILNEISANKWPTNATYRKWVVEVLSTLKTKYKHSAILCAPFSRPGMHSEDWQAVAANAYIGVECYLSGKAIKEHSFSPDWCGTQYRISKTKYTRLGVPAERLFLCEHFANTEDAPDRKWGRQGVTREEWDKAIVVRGAALHKVGFAGFMSYCWAKNRMKVSDEELIHFENTYRAQTLP